MNSDRITIGVLAFVFVGLVSAGFAADSVAQKSALHVHVLPDCLVLGLAESDSAISSLTLHLPGPLQTPS